MLPWYECIISQWAEEWWFHACSSGNWGAPKFNWLCLDSMAGDCKVASLRPLMTLFQAVFFQLELSRLTVWTSHLMEISSHDLFSDTSFGGPNIHVVRINLSLHSKHWELSQLWVSVVHGWAGVAGHLADSLSRIYLLRVSLWSSSSFDRARNCKWYFMISKDRSKHTTWSISN